MSERGIRNLAIAATLLGVVGAACFLLRRDWLEQALHSEVVGGTYQFFLVVMLGGGVSWFYRELIRVRELKERDEAKARERKEREQAEFLELYSDLVRAYNESKAVKRLLRAKAWREGADGDILLTEPYNELLERLNGVQLTFEALKRHVEGRNRLFAKVDDLYETEETDGTKDTLYGDLDRIEKYLNGVVKEYETALRPFPEAPAHLALEGLVRVKEFICSGADALDIRIDAKARFDSAISKLSQVANEVKE